MASSSVILLGLGAETAFFKSHQIFNGVTVMATVESARTSSATKPWWNLRYAWDHCPVASSNDTQASASSLTA